MIVKKYTGSTTYEAMNQLKRELGSDAIVLSTRKIRQKGLLGFLKSPIIEVTAACEAKNKPILKEENMEKIDGVSNDLITVKKMLKELSASIGEKKTEIPDILNNYYIRLLNNGVEHSIASQILNQLDESINLNDRNDKIINNIVKHYISEYIGQAQPIGIDKNRQKVIFFIGPTGVGKTTTLAKLAAKLVMGKNHEIGLITTDTYRIAAVEQLKTYSDILKLPLEIVYNSRDFERTLIKFKEKDLIFVDTAGQNHKDITSEDELSQMINSTNNKEVYLVLSGTTNYNVLKSIIKQYDFIQNYKIIFTKMDEAEVFGNILNIKYLTQNPISYITIGQNVPDDIEILDRDVITDSLIGEESYERSS